MSDIDKGDAGLLLDAFQFVLHILAQTQVQRAQRLVQKQHLRTVDQRAGDGHTLLLAAGEGRDLAVFKALEADNLQHFGHAVVDLLLGELQKPQAERDIVIHVQMWEQRVPLKDRIDLSLVRRDIIDPLSIKKHITGRRCQKTANNSQRCGFSASTGTQQCEKFLISDVKIDVIKNGFAVLKGHGKIRQANEFFGHYPPPFLHNNISTSAAADVLRDNL